MVRPMNAAMKAKHSSTRSPASATIVAVSGFHVSTSPIVLASSIDVPKMSPGRIWDVPSPAADAPAVRKLSTTLSAQSAENSSSA